MKYATFTVNGDNTGRQRVGGVDVAHGVVIDLLAVAQQRGEALAASFSDMLAVIAGGQQVRAVADTIMAASQPGNATAHAFADITLLAPVPVPAQIRDFSVFELHMQQAAVGMARLRAARLGDTGPLPCIADIKLPEVFYRQPIYYKANRFNVVGHGHEVRWPAYASHMDYELELGFFLGKQGVNIAKEQARDYIFGYTIFNDFSARDAQEYEMSAPFGPAKGKDFDTGNVIGPWLVTADEIADPYNLTMIVRVNGEEWSRGNSRTMGHRFEDMIAHVSREETLYPGEFFGSGTVGGGCGLEINRWLQSGDVVELEIEGIGVLRNRIVRPD